MQQDQHKIARRTVLCRKTTVDCRKTVAVCRKTTNAVQVLTWRRPVYSATQRNTAQHTATHVRHISRRTVICRKTTVDCRKTSMVCRKTSMVCRKTYAISPEGLLAACNCCADLLQCVAVRVAVCCSALHCWRHVIVVQICCSVLQCVLQCVAERYTAGCM